MPVNNVAALYSLPSFKGHSYNLSLDNSSRYRAAGVWELNNAGLVPTQGSISVYAGDVRYALLILFRSFYGSTYQFQGNFTMFTAAPGDWLKQDVTFQTDRYLHSAVLTAAGGKSEFRISANAVFAPAWNKIVAQMLQGQPIQQVGNPVFTWCAFPGPPTPVSGLSPNLVYARVTQQLYAEPIKGFGHVCGFSYFILIQALNNGAISAKVVAQDVWVLSGAFQSLVRQMLSCQVSLAAATVNNTLAQAFGNFSGVSEVYLLPGTLSNVLLASGVVDGNALDDLTVVIRF